MMFTSLDKLGDMSLQIENPITLQLANSESFPLEPNKIYLIDPHMVLPEETSPDCSLYCNEQDDSFSQNRDLQNLVYNSDCYTIENNESNSSINEDFDQQNEVVRYHYVTEGHEVNEGLAVLEILYNNNQNDQPEFIDVNNLTESIHSKIDDKNVLDISDEDDDDVIFVAEYRTDDLLDEINRANSINRISCSGGPRRNPVRKVRNSKASKDLEREVYYEEDFAFLEQQDELEEMNRKMTSYIKKQAEKEVDNFKKWPVNVHERPEFNEETKQIERFDYTIRKIKESVPKKKPKLETVPKPAKKKKYIPRRKKIQRAVVEKKVRIHELASLVNSTFKLVKMFLKDSDDCKKLINKDKTYEESDVIDLEMEELEKSKLLLLKNQALLSSIVNNLDTKEVADSFKIPDNISSEED